VAEFDEQRQRDYISELKLAGQSAGTIDRRLTVLIAALNHAVSPAKMLAVAPTVIRPQKVHAPGVRRFSTDDMRLVFANARTENERTMLLLWTTSLCRPGQVLDLTWDRVDFDEHTIDYRVPGEVITNKRRAKVLMPPTVQMWLQARHMASGPVISNMRKVDERVPLSTFKNHIRRICKRAGIKGSAYRIRKHASSYLLNRGVALIQVQSMLAHKLGDRETYRYTEADLPPVLVVLERLLEEIKPEWLPLARQMLVDSSKPAYFPVFQSSAV
jgi:integrase